MSEQDRIKLQAELTELIDKWLDEQIEKETIQYCPELERMMAQAALAVAEACTVAHQER